MKHLFIMNPNSGNQKKMKKIYNIIAELQANETYDIEVVFTKHESDVDQLFNHLDRTTYYRFYACGGDGTLHSIVKHCLYNPRFTLVPLPLGSGNDFIRSLDISKEAYFNVEHLMLSKPSLIDTIQVNEHVCINAASVGLDAKVAVLTNKMKEKKLAKGSFSYIVSFLLTLASSIRYRLNFSIDGKQMPVTDYNFLVIANGKYYGGGFEAAPKAKIDDGYLDVISIEALKRRKILRLAPLYRSGKHLAYKDLVGFHHAKQIYLRGEEILTLNLDGDIAYAQEVSIHINERSLLLVKN